MRILIKSNLKKKKMTKNEKEGGFLSVVRNNSQWLLKNHDSKEQEISLLDIQGRIIQSFNVSSGETKRVLLPSHSGIYFIQAKESREVWRLWH